MGKGLTPFQPSSCLTLLAVSLAPLTVSLRKERFSGVLCLRKCFMHMLTLVDLLYLAIIIPDIFVTGAKAEF